MKTTRVLSEAQEQGYAVYSGDPTPLVSSFFRWCEDTDSPYVLIRLKSTFAVVEIDLIGQTWRPTEQAGLEVAKLLEENQQGRMPGHRASSEPFHTFIYAHRVPIDKAAGLASKIVAILREPTNRENDGSRARMNRSRQ